MRTENSIRNISISIFTQIIMTILGFVSRKVFLENLGITYLGVNGLLTNVLSLLGLLEAGIGSSIVYNLYKPLAERDEDKIIALMQLYKKAYNVLAVVVFIASIALYPFLTFMIKSDESIANLTIIYGIFVIKNVIAYLFSYKWCIINADQKGYILSRRNLFFSVFITLTKIGVLYITKSYVLFLMIEVVITVVQCFYNGKVVDRLYPYVKEKNKYKLDNDTKNNIWKNVRALFLHNIGGYCVFGTDNLLISKFVSVATVGIYSNYTMIINQLTSLITPIMSGIGASVGNLIATEGEEKSYSIFNITYLVNFWIYSWCVIFLYNLLNPFIGWIFGKEYLLENFTFIIILVNCYLNGLRSSISTFKTKAGIFVQDKYVPILESLINLCVSILLAKRIGLVGVFLGTTISTLSIVFWNSPRLVYKNLFNRPVKEYFKRYVFYVILTLLSGTITTMLCNKVNIANVFLQLCIKGIITILVPNSIYIAIFFKTSEFKYLYSILKTQLNKIIILKKAVN